MSSLTKILYAIAGAAALAYVTTTAFGFFDIGFETYGNYLMWMIALVIFYTILPGSRGNIFGS